MNQLNPNKVGLAVGTFYALFHFLWVIMVATGVAKPFLDWALSLHFLSLSYSVSNFQVGTALTLVVFAFASGYSVGWVLAMLLKTSSR